ncbi:MAG: hypothetical protein V1855_01940 [bacterium]
MSSSKLKILIFCLFLPVFFVQKVVCQNARDTEKISAVQDQWAFLDKHLMSEIKEYNDSALAFFAWLIQVGLILGASEYAISCFKEYDPFSSYNHILIELIVAVIAAHFPTKALVTKLNEKSKRDALTKFLDMYSDEEYSKFLSPKLRSFFDALYEQYKKEGIEFINKIASDTILQLEKMRHNTTSSLVISVNGSIVWPEGI